MIPISPALKTALAKNQGTFATLWLVTLTNSTVLGFTDHDDDIVYSGVTYKAAVGYTKTDIATSGDLSVDNLEIDGILNSPSIDEADLAAGLWDFAAIQISLVNYSDLSQGELIYRVGTLGEVTAERGTFKAELRGMSQAYTRVIGQLTSPICRTTLGSALCTIDLSSFTFTATVTGLNPSESTNPPQQRTVLASALTQPGPSGGIAITAITRANPGHVTLASPLGLPSGSPITISGVVGMTNVNTNTYALNVSGSGFDLPDDTTGFPAYISGGTVTPLGGTSGYFDNGVVTWTSGNNNGLKMEVQSYVVGQVILFQPMPYVIQIGDTFSIHAGCDYSFPTCRDRFSNQLNFRGEPYVPGVDRIIQVGKQGG